MGKQKRISRILASKQVRDSFIPVPYQPILHSSPKIDTAEQQHTLSDGTVRRTKDTPDEDSVTGSNISIDPVEWNATATVRRKADLPDPSLQKYWLQRYSIFSKYDLGIRMDPEGWWSATPEKIAEQIAARSACTCIVDAFCGVGGNAIQFAFYCEKVIAIDNSPLRLALAKHNAKIYGVEDRITFILADFVDWVQNQIQNSSLDDETSIQKPVFDVIFMSPPWGGVDYMVNIPEPPPLHINKSIAQVQEPSQWNRYSLNRLKPLPGNQLYNLASNLTSNVVFYLPRNVDIHEIASLDPFKVIDLEEEWMSNNLKAITAYWGDMFVSEAPET